MLFEQALRHGLIELHGIEALREAVGCGGGAGGLRGDLRTVCVERGNQRVHFVDVRLQLLRGAGVGFLHHVAEHNVAREIVRRIAGTAAGISSLLPPAVLCGHQAVMAGEAIQFGVLGPDAALRFARDPLQLLA